jgi:isopenicillin N synthase-like dioxygenase
MTKFYWECAVIAKKILKVIALGIGLDDEDLLLNSHTGLNNQLRLLHYPPIPAALLESGSMARMPAHADWS